MVQSSDTARLDDMGHSFSCMLLVRMLVVALLLVRMLLVRMLL